MFKCEMSKETFVSMVTELLNGHNRLDYVDPETDLGIRNFIGWRDWFGFGEWDVGMLTIRVKTSNRKAIDFLHKWSFKQA